MRFILLLFITASILVAQDYKIVKSDDTNNKMLIGVSPRTVYKDSSFAEWFNFEYTNYDVDVDLLYANKDSFNNKLFKIVLGTWCGDSRREVPRFVKILDFVNFPKDKMFFMNVDRNKKGIGNEVEDLDIELVPTFIIYENGKEIGRIVETPTQTLEKDLLKIITKK